MGALHEGHCSLVKQSIMENDHTVVSIFVNPSQFAPHEDLQSYPKTLLKDMELLAARFPNKPVDAVFVPTVSEMYPSGITLDVGNQRGAFVLVLGCSEQLEGVTRPQFFRGVATVVSKLLNIVTPDKIYFGQKDAQQCVVIKNMVKDLLIDTEVRVLPTTREESGLAMSSRNQYLSPESKQHSAAIYRGLNAGEIFYYSQNGPTKSTDILDKVRSIYNQEEKSRFELEYLSLNHPETLDKLDIVTPGEGAIMSTAVKVPRADGSGQARLIDNVVLK
ncbi:pantothenate synthase [Scheffersomyces spartinae]|uniref:Pantoate--beta-alanine ligase n=1 Tax=Scheffersomyces spartinae TaxID=45513 RepID=A0A9P8AHY0_9ASCO|nr:pantothenate synthase [Scheffersomyces spartinae]KAG7193273.1 pantothenate synthase [Scheffersomyces spartinae]